VDTYKGGTSCIFVPEPSDALDDGNGTYTAVTLGWDDAEAYCESYGIDAHLVTMRTGATNGATDNDDVLDLVDPLNSALWWIGLYDIQASPETTGSWVWVTNPGTPLAGANYTNWLNGTALTDPNGNEDCASFDGDQGDLGEWRDEVCSTTHPFVCEFDPDP